MLAGTVRHPLGTAAFAGAVLFGLIGVVEAATQLVFPGAMIRMAGMTGWMKMLSSLDTSLLLLAGLVYGALGAAVGALWWAVVSRLAASLRRLRKREPRQATDFFSLYLYVGLSLAFFLIFVGLLVLGPALAQEGEKSLNTLPLPARIVITALLCYPLFRAFFWVIDRLLSLPLVRILRHPYLHAGLAALLLVALVGVSFVPSLLYPVVRPAHGEQVFHPEARPNIVFVVLDTCRADHFSAYGYPRPTTPRFDALARDSVMFREAISASPWTLPSHATLFTGLYPRAHGATSDHFQLDPPFFTLAEFLRACGYYTFGLSANPMVGRVPNLDQGFDRFEEVWRNQGRDALSLVKVFNRIRGRFADKGARQINRMTADWLSRRNPADPPFFLFINYLEAHGPYRPPRAFRDRFLKTDREGEMPDEVNIYDDRFVRYFTGAEDLTALELDDLRSMYDAELAYLDTRLGELLDSLEEHGLLEDALVIVLADHGENLGEHRMVDHQLCVYDTLLRVPFLLRYPPRLPAGRVVDQTVELTSVFPTVVDLMGLPQEQLPTSFQGPSILPTILEGRPLYPVTFSEYRSPAEILKILSFKAPDFDASFFDRDLIAARNGQSKYILTSNATDELYDLVRDPMEEENLCPDHRCPPDHPLRTIIGEWLERTPAYEPTTAAAGISDQHDQEAMEKLRSLGYIQ